MKNKVVCGIDYSLTSPSACIYTKGDIENFNNFQFFNLNSSISDIKRLNEFDNITSKPHINDYHDFIDRYDIISDFFIKELDIFKVKYVMIEGYSFGSKGSRLFQLAENTAILKYKIRKNKYNLDIVPPKTAKKFFSGNGNASKDIMYDAFLERTGIDIAPTKSKRSKSPYSDIVDSYAICLFKLESKLNET